MKRLSIPLDCIYEAPGAQGNSEANESCITQEETHQESLGAASHAVETSDVIRRWNIDPAAALRELQRSLHVDAPPPPLQPLLAAASLPPAQPVRRRPTVIDAQYPSISLERDAATLLSDAQRLRESVGVSAASAPTFARSCQQLYDKVCLLRPGYAAELRDRIDDTLQEASKWSSEKDAICRDVGCNSDQLKMVVDLVQFLHHEVAPALPMLLNAARQIQTLAPLYDAASERLKFLGILQSEDPDEAARRVQRLQTSMEEMDAALVDSEAACRETASALKQRYEALLAAKALKRNR